MATIKEIADNLGVSVSTVSKGLNGANDISEELRQMVLDTAVEMGYTTKRMQKEERKKFCIFVENMEYESPEQFGYDIVLGFKQAAFPANMEVTVVPITPAFQTAEKYDTYMLKNGYSGAFLIGLALHDDWMSQLADTNIPTVLFDNCIPQNPAVCSIGTDSFEGIHLGVAHLSSLGHKKIAFLNGSLNSLVSDQRQQAFVSSMAAHALPVEEELMAYGYYVADSAKYHVPNFLDAGATAIMCGSDLIAMGVIAECEKRQLSVPEDISVIGFDDLPLSSQLNPPLTTIRQNRLELGKCGYYTLYALLNRVPVSQTLLRAQFIERQSTGRCKA